MKVITQATFDEVVLENIVDFENALDVAIEEATKEFEAQGVNLGNIVKNCKLNENGSKIIHEVLEALEILGKYRGESIGEDEVITTLRKFTYQCRLSLAHRMLATSSNGYNILLSVLKTAKDDGKKELLGYSIQAMSSLTDTNPDILTIHGLELMIDLLMSWQTYTDDDLVPLCLAQWSFECCLKHEGNRQLLFGEGVPKLLKSLLMSQMANKSTMLMTCKALRAFTLDDDIRTEFGKSHDHARYLVEELDLIKLYLELVKGFLNDSDITSEILSTLSHLCVRAEYCQQAVDNGALVVINDVLVSFLDDSKLTKKSINLLKTISGNDLVKEEAMKIGASQLIISALNKHQCSIAVCESACGAISMLALRVPLHAKQFIELGAAEAVVQAMKTHPTEKQVQKMGCMAARNLACRVPQNQKDLVECGVEGVIHEALNSFGEDPAFRDVAKAALRDLGLEVKLEEQWKGTGIEIER